MTAVLKSLRLLMKKKLAIYSKCFNLVINQCYLLFQVWKNTESKNPEVVKSKNRMLKMLLSNFAVSGNKRSRFITEKEASGVLSMLGLKTPVSKLSITGNILFQRHKMNEITNKCLLVGDKFMPEMHFKTTSTYLQCLWTFTKNSEYKNLKKQEIENIFIKMS